MADAWSRFSEALKVSMSVHTPTRCTGTLRSVNINCVLKRPIYHQIDQKMFGACRMYRMLMPLLDERGNVPLHTASEPHSHRNS